MIGIRGYMGWGWMLGIAAGKWGRDKNGVCGWGWDLADGDRGWAWGWGYGIWGIGMGSGMCIHGVGNLEGWGVWMGMWMWCMDVG